MNVDYKDCSPALAAARGKRSDTIMALHPEVLFKAEQDEDGGWPRDEWELPSNAPHAVTFELAVTMPFSDDNPVRKKLPDGTRLPVQVVRAYTLAPGDRVKIPTVYRRGIRQVLCKHPDCVAAPSKCSFEDHSSSQVVMGGSCPFLRLVGEASPPHLHETVEIERKDAPATSASAATPVATAEQRALERARKRRQAGGAK